MTRLLFLVSPQTNPYWNVAVENYLVAQQTQDCIVLYLWKNRRTVVVGLNQNPFAECNVDALINDGGFVMRRTTGGGAVYHDDGNLNFSFVAPYDLYDQSRQFEVICGALREFGLQAELSGRNDLLCQGRKFSGNAFSKGRYQRLHHGTLLIKGNMDDLQRYLKVRPAKLLKHGVASVQSRVVNLSELADVTSDNIVAPLLLSFENVYGEKATHISFDELIQREEVCALYEKYSSDEWLFRHWRSFSATKSAQFEWGVVDLSLSVEDDIIIHVQIASDALDLTALDDARRILCGADIKKRPPTESAIVGDILSMVY